MSQTKPHAVSQPTVTKYGGKFLSPASSYYPVFSSLSTMAQDQPARIVNTIHFASKISQEKQDINISTALSPLLMIIHS